MTHEPETAIDADVTEWFQTHFGSDHVETSPYQREINRYPDILVRGPVCDYAVEVENDRESVIHGVGQVLLYASTSDRYVPLVVTPDDHVDARERYLFERTTPVHIREWPSDFPQ